MDNFLTQIFTNSNNSEIGILTAILVIIGTFLLSSFVAFIYQKTNNPLIEANNEYAKIIIILSVVISMIMLTIGGSIAGAFTMAGALSMVRFRNNIKNTRDIGFVFFAIAVWMAMWMQFFTIAIIGTILISAIFWIIYNFDLFNKNIIKNNYNLIISVDENQNPEKIFSEIFDKYQMIANLISIEKIEEIDENLNKKILQKLTFSLESEKNLEIQNFVNDIKNLQNNKLFILTKTN